MAVPSGTYQTYQAVGRREDLTDVIHDISPTKTPFMSSIGKGSATQKNHEWQTDALAAADGTNKVIEGDDPSNDSATATVRLGNYTQLMDKVIQVASSNRVGAKAGRDDELSYQRSKRIKEIKRDMEARLTGNYASAAGAAGTARECAGFEAWIQTNYSRGTGGSSTAFSAGIQAAATDGTQRAFDESMLKAVLASMADNGGEVDGALVLMGSFNKQAASTFEGIAQQRQQAGGQLATIVAGADVYVSDFGRVNMVYSQFSRSRSALVVDPSLWKLCYYQPFKVEDLAKTGHSDRQLLSVEFTLESSNEKGSGVVADLTTA
jgi:hypothetical protein